ncbi:MAG: TonB-dependent receptor plug domain-containing protein [Deltaproteobacteria bacterium]
MNQSVRLFLIVLAVTLSLSDKARSESVCSGVGNTTELEPIVVTAKRSPSLTSDTSENIAVLSGDQTAGIPAEDLSDVLKTIPGVDVEPVSGVGKATALSIQGCAPRQVRTMVDGIPFNTQLSGQANPSIFPVEDIKRVEVIRGPGSSAWGSSLGGVVNVITKDTGTTAVPRGSLSASYGGYDTQKESFELSGKALGVGYYVMEEHLDSGGKGPRDDALQNNFFNKLSYTLPDDGKVTGSFGYSGGDINSKFPDMTWQAQPYRAAYGKIGLEDEFEGTRVLAELKHSRQDLVTRLFPAIEDDTPFFEINSKDRLYEVSLVASRPMRKADTLVAGLDADYDIIKSDPYLPKAKNLRSAAPYANYTLNLGRWDFIAGGRYDYNSEFGGQFSPSAGAVYRFEDAWKTVSRARVSRAFNAPPLLWEFNSNPALGIVPNPAIKAERGTVYELETETSPIEPLRLKASAYRADIRDALATDEIAPGTFMVRNFQKFRRQGGQLEARWSFTRRLSLSAAAEFNDVENRETGKTVRGTGSARQGFNGALEYSDDVLFARLDGYYKRWNSAVSAQENDKKVILDAKLCRKLYKGLSAFINAYNLTNSSYWSDVFFPLRKRYFEAGLKLVW